MSLYRALVRVAGVATLIAATDSLDPGAGIDPTNNQALSIGATHATTITIGRTGQTVDFPGSLGAITIVGALTQGSGAVALTGNAASSLTTSSGALTVTSAAAATWSTGAGALTLSGAAGINLQGGSTTALVVNTAGTAVTVQAGATLATTSTGNINLPNNASARFQIEGAGVGASVTAANLLTLTNNGDASALHTHTNTTAGAITATGLTTTGLAAGDIGYASGTTTMSKAQSDGTAAQALLIGVNSGTSGQMSVAGVVTMNFTTASGAPSAGVPVYLAAAADDTGAGAGKATKTEPTTGYSVPLGIVLDPTNYAGSKTCVVLLRIEPRTLMG